MCLCQRGLGHASQHGMLGVGSGGVRREMNLISLSGLNFCKRIWGKSSAMMKLLTAAFMIDVFTAPVFKRIISGF